MSRTKQPGSSGEWYTPEKAIKDVAPFVLYEHSIGHYTGIIDPFPGDGRINHYFGNMDLIHKDFFTPDAQLACKDKLIVTNPPYSKLLDFLIAVNNIEAPFFALVPLSVYDSKDRVQFLKYIRPEILIPGGRYAFEHPKKEKNCGSCGHGKKSEHPLSVRCARAEGPDLFVRESMPCALYKERKDAPSDLTVWMWRGAAHTPNTIRFI